jgi:hypothetical protein
MAMVSTACSTFIVPTMKKNFFIKSLESTPHGSHPKTAQPT